MSALSINPLEALPWYSQGGEYSIQRYILDGCRALNYGAMRLNDLGQDDLFTEPFMAFLLGLIPAPKGVAWNVTAKRMAHIEDSNALDERQKDHLHGVILGLIEGETEEQRAIHGEFISTLDALDERDMAMRNHLSSTRSPNGSTAPPPELWSSDLSDQLNLIGSKMGLGDGLSEYRGIISDHGYMLNISMLSVIGYFYQGVPALAISKNLEHLVSANPNPRYGKVHEALTPQQWRAAQDIAARSIGEEKGEKSIGASVAENLPRLTWDHLVELNSLADEYNLEWAIAAMEWNREPIPA